VTRVTWERKADPKHGEETHASYYFLHKAGEKETNSENLKEKHEM